MNRFMLGLLILATLLFYKLPLEARVLLKPCGSNSMPLCTRSISADTTISGQFATTVLNLTFQNESSYQMEAEFMYELPPGAVATYFAYWAREEKVVARVVEKEEAKKIYETIAYSWSRDPALIEMAGKNTFRARIFPVFPNDDLKVEIHFVQILPSDKNGAVYTLPIFDKNALDPLDAIDVKIRVKPDASISNVTNNYGIPVQHDASGYAIGLSGKNYMPPKDLNIRITHKPAKMNASLYAAPSDSSDGYFALALSPDHSLTNPNISISGIKTYDVSPARLSPAKANKPLVLFGRYKGAGKATVTLCGKFSARCLTYSAAVTFRSTPEPNNLATKLWAASKIRRLSTKKANRAEVIDISQRFGMPSKFTSWLAVPKDEMKFYRRQKNNAKINAAATPVIEMIKRGEENSDQGQALINRFSNLCKEIGLDPGEELSGRSYDVVDSIRRDIIKAAADGKDTTAQHDRLLRLFGIDYSAKQPDFVWQLMEELAKKIVEQKHSGASDNTKISALTSQLEQLAAPINNSTKMHLENAEMYYQNNRIHKLAYQLLDLLKAGKGESPEAQNVRGELAGNENDKHLVTSYLRSAIYDTLGKTCRNLPELIQNGGDAKAAIAQLQKECGPVAREAGLNFINLSTMYVRSKACGVAQQLADIVTQGKESTPEGRLLVKQLAILSSIAQTDQVQIFESSANTKLSDLAWKLVGEQKKPRPDKHAITDLRTKIKRLETRSGKSAEGSIKAAENEYKLQDLGQAGSELAALIIDGKNNSKTARAVSARFHTLCAQLHINPKVQLQNYYKDKMYDLAYDYAEAKYKERSNAADIALIKNKMQLLEHLAGVSVREAIAGHEDYGLDNEIESLQDRLEAEMERTSPNEPRLNRLAKRYKALAAQYHSMRGNSSMTSYIDEYAGNIDPTINACIRAISLSKQLEAAKSKGDAAKTAQMEKQYKEVRASFDEKLSILHYAARWGDPLISVDAPADALRVVAIMPDGEIKTLEYNTDTRKWEVRFDIPSYADEGEYAVTVIVVLNDGNRKQIKLSYNVDVTPPTGKATAIMSDKVKLEINASEDTARVAALLPWGERVEMRSSTEPGKFCSIVPLPDNYKGMALVVSYVLTDNAHNRTTVTINAGSE